MSKQQSPEIYKALKGQARQFLASCGHLTLIEELEGGAGREAISANEMLGMATRIMAEAALEIQAEADAL